jgi:hypothetical protein
MSLTLEEIVTHQNRLRREIVERECLLAAFNVLHGYFTSGQGPTNLELGSLVSALGNSAPLIALQDAPAPVAPAPLPAAVTAPHYIHPDLQAIGRGLGRYTALVKWAIEQMTVEFSLRDIEKLLRREGVPIKSASISVVLTRLKRRGEITEVAGSAGPHPAVFRKPETAIIAPVNRVEFIGAVETSSAADAAA